MSQSICLKVSDGGIVEDNAAVTTTQINFDIRASASGVQVKHPFISSYSPVLPCYFIPALLII